jgi:hypothetical protein
MSSRSLRIIRAGLSVVGNTYNPATQEVEIRKIKVQGQPGKKVRLHLNKQVKCSGSCL